MNPWFQPTPIAIEWDFGDPFSGNNTSTELYPSHKFSNEGTYEVKVIATYPSGRIEKTSREVEVLKSPEPDLGPDLSICPGDTVTLDASCGPWQYSWSTGDIGVSSIQVSDTGWYWVNVRNGSNGCATMDSIHISMPPPSQQDTTAMQILPTTCGGTTGSITGMQITGNGPYTYYWLNQSQDTIAYTLNIYNLPAGYYSLHTTGPNACPESFGPWQVDDLGDVLIQNIGFDSVHCNQQTANITITANSQLSENLFYSIDNGNNYYQNQGLFTNLYAGSYYIKVKDSSQCLDIWHLNPITINNIPGPEVTEVATTPCQAGQSNGTVNITAASILDSIHYSINSGISYQVNNGFFTNLSPGIYNCLVKDDYGCDTTFQVEVEEQEIIYLQAVAGDGESCPENKAYVPLKVTNFTDVSTFKANLLYNNNLVNCQGYANAHPQITDSLTSILYSTEGRVELNWHSSPLTLPAQSTIADLVFEPLTPGTGTVDWYGQAGYNYFLNPTGDSLQVNYQLGNIKIYQEVSFTIEPEYEYCEGEEAWISPTILTSNGPVSYLWVFPQGDTQQIQNYQNDSITQSQSGTYTISATDTAGCKAQNTFELWVYKNPVPAFSSQDSIETEIEFELDAGAGYYSYFWNTGATTQQIIVTEDGWYTAFIESTHGCMGHDSIYVWFTQNPPPPPPPEPKNPIIYMPNAFSPNGDGLNDTYMPVTEKESIPNYHILIYDRWGKLLFESKDIHTGWDGKQNNKACPKGTYVYRVQYTLEIAPPEERVLYGSFVLVK